MYDVAYIVNACFFNLFIIKAHLNYTHCKILYLWDSSCSILRFTFISQDVFSLVNTELIEFTIGIVSHTDINLCWLLRSLNTPPLYFSAAIIRIFWKISCSSLLFLTTNQAVKRINSILAKWATLTMSKFLIKKWFIFNLTVKFHFCIENKVELIKTLMGVFMKLTVD